MRRGPFPRSDDAAADSQSRQANPSFNEGRRRRDGGATARLTWVQRVGLSLDSTLATAPFTQSYQFWFIATVVTIDFTAFGAFTVAAQIDLSAGKISKLLAMVTAALFLCMAIRITRAYDVSTPAALRTAALGILQTGLLASLVVSASAWNDHRLPGTAVIATGTAGVLVAVVGRLICLTFGRFNASHSGERLVLVGTARALNRIVGSVSASRVQIVGCVTIGERGSIAIPQCGHIELHAEERQNDMASHRFLPTALDRVVIISADLDETTLQTVLNRLEHVHFEIALAPTTTPFPDRGNVLDSCNCVSLRPPAAKPLESIAKRVFDLSVATIFLTICAPLFIVIATLIRLESPGPALFRQTRWGRNCEPFTIYKFRSMWVDAPDGGVQASLGDQRVTRVGAILRRTSLDELPQLLNVMEGTMSLVGPRPHPVELNRRFLGAVDRYLVRHRVLPGITGLAQVNGSRGETRCLAAMQRRLDYDLEYIQARSFGLDLWILARTVGALVGRRNAY